MSRQDIIREGIFTVVREADYEELPEITWEYNLTDRILKYLHSQGVVIKADRELPDNEIWHKVEREFEAYCAGRNELIEAGYEAVEPLVEK